MLEFVLVAEGKTDEAVVPALVERILKEEGDSWIKDHCDLVVKLKESHGQELEPLWCWSAIEKDTIYQYTTWVKIKQLGDAYKKKLRIYRRPGEGERTAETRKAIALCQLLRKEKPAALILARDLDKKPVEHRDSMEVARAEARTRSSRIFPIVLASPNKVVEVWMMHEFEPADDHEKNQLQLLRQQHGFDPRLHGHQFNSDEAKAAISHLICDKDGNEDRERRKRCWMDTELRVLRERGGESYLTDFLKEVQEQLLPLLTSKSSGQV